MTIGTHGDDRSTVQEYNPHRLYTSDLRPLPHGDRMSILLDLWGRWRKRALDLNQACQSTHSIMCWSSVQASLFMGIEVFVFDARKYAESGERLKHATHDLPYHHTLLLLRATECYRNSAHAQPEIATKKQGPDTLDMVRFCWTWHVYIE